MATKNKNKKNKPAGLAEYLRNALFQTKCDILKIVENNTKKPRLHCLSFFLDFV
jgi:hypothetical protein